MGTARARAWAVFFMKYRPLVSFSGTFGAYAPGDIIDEDTLTAPAIAHGVIEDWLRAGFIVPIKDAPEKATAPAATENAALPDAEAGAATVNEARAKKSKGK